MIPLQREKKIIFIPPLVLNYQCKNIFSKKNTAAEMLKFCRQ